MPCQPGFELRMPPDGSGLLSCRCVRDMTRILDCEEDVIILNDGFWGVEEDEPTPHLDLTVCPATYCRCHYRGGQNCETLFFQHDPTLDLQCHPLRNGEHCSYRSDLSWTLNPEVDRSGSQYSYVTRLIGHFEVIFGRAVYYQEMEELFKFWPSY